MPKSSINSIQSSRHGGKFALFNSCSGSFLSHAGQENLERINETGQIGSQDQQVINISTFDSAGLENYVRMNPEEFARAFNVAKNSGYLEME